MWRALYLLGLSHTVLLAAPLPTVQENTLYYPAEWDEEQLKALKEKLVKPSGSQAQWHFIPLSATPAKDKESTQRVAKAIAAGVRSLPCLVMRHKGQIYAKLEGEELRDYRVTQAEKDAASCPNLSDDFPALVSSELYLLRSELAGEPKPTTGSLRKWIYRCQLLADNPACTEELEQLLRLDYLYPLLLQLYTQLYDGAHSVETEQIFLDAVKELEKARDIDRVSHRGRTAYQMREELRKERLRAKVYD